MDKDLQRSLELLNENEYKVQVDAENMLLTICQNILLHPNNEHHRKVKLDDSALMEKLLPAIGAMECLFDLGFVEAADSFVLPKHASLSKLKALQRLLEKKYIQPSSINNSKAYNVLPATTTPKEKKFFVQIIQRFQNVLRYEDLDLQEKAKKVIPIVDLEIATMARIRELQKRFKLNNPNLEESSMKQYDDHINARNLFLMELLHWFKYKFFTWVDSPRCTACSENCKYHTVELSDNPKCSRVEIHKCTKCSTLVKFPRYSDPEPLLKLRRGRCGEWANVFTLLCRALGYDARFVHDETDHVWTEVWCEHEKRWIHVDPCEDVMDHPLMYEKGWKKKLSYIIAYSKDEVQDTTWRYTQDQAAVMKRRNICSENSLLQLIESLNKQRQFSTNYSATRRQFVIKRRVLELVELIHMPGKQNSDNEKNYHGRSTGSYEWKLSRGEISQGNTQTNYSWDISKYGNTFQLQYSIVQDTYKIIDGKGSMIEQLSGWQNGVNEVAGIFRKVEHDWKMVYLSCSPGTTCGKVKWNFIITNPKVHIHTFILQSVVKVYHKAFLSWEVEAFFDNSNQSKSLTIPINECSNYRTDQIKGSVKLILTATLSCGEGDCAWQHAQLFRQSLENKNDQSLRINIRLENR